jgi:hypothetical protein
LALPDMTPAKLPEEEKSRRSEEEEKLEEVGR